MLLNCLFDGAPSPLFEKLPNELINIILNFMKPEYVFIERYAKSKIRCLNDFEEIFMAMVIADAVCDIADEPNDIDAPGFVLRILRNQYFIVTSDLLYFKFVGGDKCTVENVKIAFEVLNLDNKWCKLKIPKHRDLFVMRNYLVM